jgi:bifunctional enzyme CysN/CysC
MKTNVKKITEPATRNLQPATSQREQLKIVIVGHVDHGKSTLVGRLFHDTGSLPDGKFEAVKKASEKRGMPFEWSFLMDALQAERDQGITIDTSQIWFKTKKRDYVIIDAPGHKEFLKNMVSGAANSEAALLIIDAKEGVKEQSKRHGYLLHLLGVTQIAVIVNKMDMVNYDEKTFRAIEKEYKEYLSGISVIPTFVIPISAREGDNIVVASSKLQVAGKKSDATCNLQPATYNMPWYDGPTIIGALDKFKRKPELDALPLRLPVQDVYKFDERRIVVGRIESGSLNVGDEILVSPSNKVVKVASIETWNAPAREEVSAGQSVGITLSEQIFVERGHIISHQKNAPFLTNIFRARLFWLGDRPLTQGNRYLMKLGTSEHPVEVIEIEQVVDTGSLDRAKAAKVEKGAVVEIILKVRGIAALDAFEDNAKTGRFVLLENFKIIGGGIIDLKGFPNHRSDKKVKSTNITMVESKISPQARQLANGHKGGVLWLTGLSGSGKSTLANELQARLFERGYQVYILDGDNIRRGLNADLDFSPKGRSENIRRVGETAALFADAGVICITAFISPYKADRHRARVAAGENFHHIYVKADVETCAKRDPKGLYAKAKAGEIKDFTGISAPFEEPLTPDVVIETAKMSIEESVAKLLDYVETNLVKPVREASKKLSDYQGQGI